MLEAVVAVVGMLICGWSVMAAIATLRDREIDKTLGGLAALVLILALMGSAALYFLVRFAHWAWETPIPFLDRFTS
jgi:uncharacterized membrane protein YraQ (UPF0718 family)